MCARHQVEWRQAKSDGVNKSQFLAQAKPLTAALGTTRQRCRLCPDRGVHNLRTQLCHTHHNRWLKLGRPPLEEWAKNESPLPSFGPCLVVICSEPARSPLGLCHGHHQRYDEHGRPGGRRMKRHWATVHQRTGKIPAADVEDEGVFREWCERATSVLVTGQVSLEGLPKLLIAELKWGLFDHYQQAQPSHWSIGAVRRTVRSCRKLNLTSLGGPEHPRVCEEPAPNRMIIRGIRESLRKIYFSKEDTKDAGFIETEHFGRRFESSSGYLDLTTISQRWLRDLLWEYMAGQLKSVKCPRSRSPFDQARRSVVQLGAFLAAQVPQADDDPTVLTTGHAEDFVADLLNREREGLPALGLRLPNGKPPIVNDTARRLTLTSTRKVAYWSLEAGHAEGIGLSRDFITSLPTGGTDPKKSRNPFSDDVARALADEDNLQMFADTHDPVDYGLRDIWETLVFTGRRASEVIKLRLDCTARHNNFPMLWHDQTKVGNYNDGIRIPEYLFDRLEERRQKTLIRFEDFHGRRPTRAERPLLALFPSPTCNKNRRKAISYGHFHTSFSAWVVALDLGTAVPHQARHTLATKLLKHGASLAHIRRYLGQVSDRMAEHYAKVASSELDDVLHAVWVSGPGSASPGQLLSGERPLSQHEAMALALDLSRRSTPAEGGFCTYQAVVDGAACPWNLDCENCDKFVLSGADLVYWRRKQQQWQSMAERAPDDKTADYLHSLFEPTARAIDGLERALAGMGLLEQALSLDLRRPQDYFERVWSTAFRAADLANLAASEDISDDHDQMADAS
ncbi:site-specific integrase [Streptomyces sp. NBC_00452]|uniref:tyrosine-type recombinase/integrase n=1 Tax=Streptomyces sp. NBC_00452 TaxID=2975746 RepID=UPI002253B7AF|nr:site-specific integrase [Streptomyces sp. NBC_00452]MCX5061696.1 site-specific integrase [Streptomyces sp. NBC_00452]